MSPERSVTYVSERSEVSVGLKTRLVTVRAKYGSTRWISCGPWCEIGGRSRNQVCAVATGVAGFSPLLRWSAAWRDRAAEHPGRVAGSGEMTKKEDQVYS